jgi:hypothetical protein
MHRTDHSRFRHSHEFALDSSVAERRTRIVIAITAAMMVLEISAGVAFNSMALLADGWHMGTQLFQSSRMSRKPQKHIASCCASTKSSSMSRSRRNIAAKITRRSRVPDCVSRD